MNVAPMSQPARQPMWRVPWFTASRPIVAGDRRESCSPPSPCSLRSSSSAPKAGRRGRTMPAPWLHRRRTTLRRQTPSRPVMRKPTLLCGQAELTSERLGTRILWTRRLLPSSGRPFRGSRPSLPGSHSTPRTHRPSRTLRVASESALLPPPNVFRPPACRGLTVPLCSRPPHLGRPNRMASGAHAPARTRRRSCSRSVWK